MRNLKIQGVQSLARGHRSTEVRKGLEPTTPSANFLPRASGSASCLVAGIDGSSLGTAHIFSLESSFSWPENHHGVLEARLGKYGG